CPATVDLPPRPVRAHPRRIHLPPGHGARRDARLSARLHPPPPARPPRMQAMSHHVSRPRVAACTLAIALACLLGGCSHDTGEHEVAPAFVQHGSRIEVPADSPLRQRLKVAPVELHQAPHELDFPATVEADPAHMANVLPALAGRVIALKVDLGDRVEHGQLLAVIDSGDLAQAYADTDKARDALGLAQKTLDRARGVQQGGVMQAQAEYRRAQTRLAALGGSADAKAGARPMQVRAPISGTITALSIAPGMFVNDPTAALMTIANIDKVWVTAQVPENELGQV